ncbi:hypothetical protein [Paenibacillus glacialis]|uniref:Aminotransferase class I/classII domain-containing protein n=1 Tax=Paenibacillus glacialis TaxID=494026 RepID=A0A168JIU5_9BACL|nr:hypothetical protein [Paenibacillus glacialis]OAB40689.1 hypothetical protein PGLA_17980 [Paenibacillus glacialis]
MLGYNLNEHLPEVIPFYPDGTFLLWVVCRGLERSVEELKHLMYEKAVVAFSEGSVFEEEAQGYLRINLACPRVVLHRALERFCHAAKTNTIQTRTLYLMTEVGERESIHK